MPTTVFAAVLAAGGASRFGSTKQLAAVDGSPMVRHVLQSASRVFGEHTLLVTGHDCTNVAAACAGLPGFVTVNEGWQRGIGGSIAHAVSVLPQSASAVVVLLADQPRVDEHHLQAIVDAWSGDDEEIIATSYAGTRGAPVLFPRSCFPELAVLDGDRGGRHLIDDERYCVTTVDCQAAALDIDTPADLTRI
ncbi:MAG: nucleotidyltransferase family protein [Woeseiaceae bacterium]|nr:nucleotidyltransferase family protein [Woeseiaceae bacterium]